jgi:hypothetical protein
MNIRSIATLAKVLHTVTSFGSSVKCHDVYWPEGALFRNPFGTGPPEGPLSLRDNGGFEFVFVSEKIFLREAIAQQGARRATVTVKIKCQ